MYRILQSLDQQFLVNRVVGKPLPDFFIRHAGTVLPMPIAGTGSTAGVRGVEGPEGKMGFHKKAGTQNGIPADDL